MMSKMNSRRLIVKLRATWCLKRSFLQSKQCSTQAGGTLDKQEVQRFSANAHTFWDEVGQYGALHRMNELRVPLVRTALVPRALPDDPRPLSGLRLADIGCGGGVLAEPLARLGASVVGVDASESNIAVAKAHLARDKRISDSVRFLCTTVEDVAEAEIESFDALIASEVIEHVQNQLDFVASCVQLVKPGGSLFLTTINRSSLAWLLGVIAAEQLLRIVPQGTHDWDKFLSPQDLQHMLRTNGCSTRLCHGMFYNPATRRWNWTRNTEICYALHAVKH